MQNDLKRAIVVLKKAKHIWIIGDGGLSSTANHFSCDLLKNAHRPAISLCSNCAIITAIANDYSFEETYLLQLRVLFKKGDVLVILSTSGKSRNLVASLAAVNNFIAIIGGRKGFFLNKKGIVLFVNGEDQMDIEDGISKVCHEVVKELNK